MHLERAVTSMTEPKPGFRIETCWMFTAIDENDQEGLIGARIGRNKEWFPFVCADPERVDSLIEMAKAIGADSGRRVRLLKFSNLEVIDEDLCNGKV